MKTNQSNGNGSQDFDAEVKEIVDAAESLNTESEKEINNFLEKTESLDFDETIESINGDFLEIDKAEELAEAEFDNLILKNSEEMAGEEDA